MSEPVNYAVPAYRKARADYHVQCALEHCLSLLVGDAFLAKLLTALGLDAATVGVISSLISLAFVVQLLSIPLVRRLRNTKKTVLIFNGLSFLFFGCTYLLPFLPISGALRTALVFLCIGGGFTGKYLVLYVYYRWANGFVDPGKRGVFAARNEMISLAVGIVFSWGIGKLVDTFEASGNISGAFLVVAAVILAMTAADLVMLRRIPPEDQAATDAQRQPLGKVLKATLGNKPFLYVLLMQCLYYAAYYFSVGFMGTFKTEDLLLNVGTVQLINNGGYLLRLAVSRPFGRYSDRTSFARGYILGLVLTAGAFVFGMLTQPSSWWLIIVYTLLLNMAGAGTNANATNMTYSYVETEYFTYAQCIKASAAGVVGFLASLVGSAVLRHMQAGSSTVFGIPVIPQQFLCGVSALLMLGTALYAALVVARQKAVKR